MASKHQQAFIQVIEQNNGAAILMENGDFESAVDCLASALHACRKIIDDSDQDAVDSPCCMLSLDQCMQLNKVLPTSSKDFEHFEDQVSEQQYIHDQPLWIPFLARTHPSNNIVVGSVVAFNLALALQLSALDSEEDFYSNLAKAAKLYELGFTIQQVQPTGPNVLFTLATINNLGLVHSQLRDEPNANKCFEYVLSTLMFLTDSDEPIEVELDGFFRNVSAVSPAHAARAA